MRFTQLGLLMPQQYINRQQTIKINDKITLWFIKKSQDYVYGMWQYKALSMKKLFQSKNHLNGKMTGKTWVIYKNMNKGKKSIVKSSLLYQTYIPTVT